MRPYLNLSIVPFALFLMGLAHGAAVVGRAFRRAFAAGRVLLRLAARRLRRYLTAMPGPCVLAAALSLAGCSAAQGRAVGAEVLTLAEGACEALLPMAFPGYGALDVLGCKTAESLLAGAIGAAGPPPAPSGSMLGGGGAAPRDVVHRKLKVRGDTFAMVRDTPERIAVMQAWIDARTSNAATKATKP